MYSSVRLTLDIRDRPPTYGLRPIGRSSHTSRSGSPHVVTKAAFQVTAQSGNMDVGVFKGTTLLGSTGSTAVPAAGIKTLNFSAPIQLWPGVVYGLAMACDNTTAAFVMHNGNAIFTSSSIFGGFFADTSFPASVAHHRDGGRGPTQPVTTLG